MTEKKAKPEPQNKKNRKQPGSDAKKYGAALVIYIVLRMTVIGAMVFSVINKKYENLLVCILCLILFSLPSFMEKKLEIELPSVLEVIIILFIFSAQILGEIGAYYVKFPYWDAILHILNGFWCAAIGFALLDIINKNPRYKFALSPLYLSIVAFSFSMTIGVLWEIFEFGADVFFHTDMQKDYIIQNIYSVKLNADGLNSPVALNAIYDTAVNGRSLGIDGYLDIGLIDTMKDLIVNFIGALLFCPLGFLYVKNRGKKTFASNFIPYLKEKKKN